MTIYLQKLATQRRLTSYDIGWSDGMRLLPKSPALAQHVAYPDFYWKGYAHGKEARTRHTKVVR